jgi:hypothetical protein
MTKNLDEPTEHATRADARAVEANAAATEPYPEGTRIRRPNRPTRMFNVRLTDEQLAELREVAQERHLPVSTMARSWLLERLDQERRAG